MSFRAVMVDAAHSAFEDRKKAFDRVGVDVTPRPFALSVVHGGVAGEHPSMGLVAGSLVSDQYSVPGDAMAEDGGDVMAGERIDHEAARAPGAAIDEGQDLVFLDPAAARVLRCRPGVRIPTQKRLIHLDDPAAGAELVKSDDPDRLSDAMHEEPGGLVCDLKTAGDLRRRYALFARAAEITGGQPFMERNVGALEDRALANRELTPAGPAFLETNALNAVRMRLRRFGLNTR